MKPVKVLYVITGLYIGGAERLLLDTVRRLDRGRFEPVVVTLVGGDLIPFFREAGIRVADARVSRQWPFPGIWRLARIIARERPQIIHTHLIHADCLGRVLGRMFRVPVIVTTLHMVEDARRRFPYRIIDRLCARLNTALVAVAEGVKRELADLEGLDPDRITVIPNAVADSAEVPIEDVRALRTGLGYEAGHIIVGIVSRLEVPRKGHRLLFEALRRLRDRHGNLRCVVVGDGEGRGELEQCVRELGLSGCVTFAGTQQNVSGWLTVMDIFALPSLLEGFPMAVIEAMAHARPIIATRVGGVSELIRDGNEGLLVPPGDVGALTCALERLIRDPDLRRRLGDAARSRFVEFFEIGRAVAATQALYESSLGSRGASRRIRLVEVVTNFDPGGVPRHVNDLVGSLSETLFDIGIVSGEENPGRVPQSALGHFHVPMVKPIAPCADLRSLWRLVRTFVRLKPDIVHSHMSKANCLASIAARCAGVPCVVNTIHGQTTLTQRWSFTQAVFDCAELLTLRVFSHRTISVSRATTRHLLRSRKVSAPLVATVHNGVAGIVSAETDRADVRRHLGIADSARLILMTGRLAEPKRPQTLVDACALIVGEFPDLKCAIAGDGPLRDEVLKRVRQSRLEDTVLMLGHRDDVPRLLAAADIFVLCSWQEGLSISVLEAMSAGLPVVASRIPGMEEAVVHGRTGYLVKEGSAAECAGALRALLSDPAQCRLMGMAGRERFQQHFRLSRQLAQTEALLRVWQQETAGRRTRRFV